MKTKLALVLFIFLGATQRLSTKQARCTDADRIRLAEAFRIGETLGNRLWRDWDKAPFAVLLVTAENEFLIRHPRPSADFTLVGYDALLKSNVYFRKRTQRLDLLATFPILGRGRDCKSTFLSSDVG